LQSDEKLNNRIHSNSVFSKVETKKGLKSPSGVDKVIIAFFSLL